MTSPPPLPPPPFLLGLSAFTFFLMMLSHTGGKLYLPPSLLRLGLRALIYMASFTPLSNHLGSVKRKLEEDERSKRPPLSPRDIIILLEKCLKYTYFLHKSQYYLQIHGAAMGSPLSPVVCNLYMQNFEQIALVKVENPPRWWKRYVDDTYTVAHRAKTVVSEREDRRKELDHLRGALI